MGFMKNYSPKYANFAVEEVGEAKTAAATEDETAFKRIDRRKLERIYLSDPQSFNTINKMKQLIMSAGYKIETDKKGSQSKYDEFFNNLGTIGLKMDTTQLLDSITHDSLEYGSAYVERIYDGSDSKIVDLKMVDSKLMDYARDKDNIIVTDENQNPVGYTMLVGSFGNSVGDDAPENVAFDNDRIFLEARRIAHFKLFSFGNRFESIGIIEPAFLDVERKHKIETAAANSIHNTASYPVIGYVGSDTRHASRKQMTATLDALQNLQHSRYMVFEHPTRIEALEVKHSDQIDQVLRYLRTNQSAASGMALGFSVGTGESINRSTLSTQQKMLDLSLESIADIIASQFNKLILDVLKEVNGYSSPAKLIFGNIVAEEKNDKIQRLVSSVENKIISPQEARQYVLFAEDLEPNEESYKKFIEGGVNNANNKDNIPNNVQDKLPKEDKKVNKNKKDISGGKGI